MRKDGGLTVCDRVRKHRHTHSTDPESFSAKFMCDLYLYCDEPKRGVHGQALHHTACDK